MVAATSFGAAFSVAPGARAATGVMPAAAWAVAIASKASDDALPGGGAKAELELLDRRHDGRVIAGGRHDHARCLVELDETNVKVLRQVVDERARGGDRRLQPVRADVGRCHRCGHVDGEHHDRRLTGDLGGVDRLGEPDHRRDQGGGDGCGGNVATPAGPARCHRIEQLDVGESHGVMASSSLENRVSDDETGDEQQEPQHGRAEKAHDAIRSR